VRGEKLRLGGGEVVKAASEAAGRRGEEGGRVEVGLSEEVVRGVKGAAGKVGGTLFMGLLAGLKVLLMRYSGEEEVVVGSVVANRREAGMEEMIGFMANTVVMRSRVREEARYAEVVEEVREVSLGAYANQDVPFEKVVEEVQPERGGGETPLFQVMFVLQNAPMEPLQLPGLTLTLWDLDIDKTKFDLTIVVTENNEVFNVTFLYKTELFSRAMIARMAGHFTVLLESVVKYLEMPVSQLPMMTPEERQTLMAASASSVRRRTRRSSQLPEPANI
jgi:non-ribosomal peptide synthetase component F